MHENPMFIENKLMKPSVRFEKTRCRVACVERSFFLDFLVTFTCPERSRRVIKKKSKHIVFIAYSFEELMLKTLLRTVS